jgi:hypothetical protein
MHGRHVAPDGRWNGDAAAASHSCKPITAPGRTGLLMSRLGVCGRPGKPAHLHRHQVAGAVDEGHLLLHQLLHGGGKSEWPLHRPGLLNGTTATHDGLLGAQSTQRCPMHQQEARRRCHPPPATAPAPEPALPAPTRPAPAPRLVPAPSTQLPRPAATGPCAPHCCCWRRCWGGWPVPPPGGCAAAPLPAPAPALLGPLAAPALPPCCWDCRRRAGTDAAPPPAVPGAWPGPAGCAPPAGRRTAPRPPGAAPACGGDEEAISGRMPGTLDMARWTRRDPNSAASLQDNPPAACTSSSRQQTSRERAIPAPDAAPQQQPQHRVVEQGSDGCEAQGALGHAGQVRHQHCAAGQPLAIIQLLRQLLGRDDAASVVVVAAARAARTGRRFLPAAGGRRG